MASQLKTYSVCGDHAEQFAYRVSRDSIHALIKYGVPAMTHNSMGEYVLLPL